MDEHTTPSDPISDEELGQREAPLLTGLGLETPAPAVVAQRHKALMQQARLSAAEHGLKALDRALESLLIGRQLLPDAPLEVPPFGTLRCDLAGPDGAELHFVFALAPGRMIDRSAVLAYEQRLVTAYAHPTSLAIALHPLDGGAPVEVPGPGLEDDTLVWRTATAHLGGHWRQYRPRLDCFLPEAQRASWDYQLGQAASAEKAPATGPAPQSRAHIFSVEEESAAELVVGIEAQPADPAAFEAFRQALGRALGQMRIPYTCVSEFAASGRLYLSLAPADRPRLEACIDHFNQGP